MALRSREVPPRTTQAINQQGDTTHVGQHLTQIMTTPTLATQVNPFHNDIDLNTAEGKKLYQRATTGLPDSQKYDGDPKTIFKFVERIASAGEDFGWKSAGENIGPNAHSVFRTPGQLNAATVKQHCDPKWADNTNLQFCILSNMFFVFVKNSIHQEVMDDLQDDVVLFTRPGGGDGATLLISIYTKNSHGTVASAIVAKTELLSVNSKDFGHNIQDVNRFFHQKNNEINFAGQSNPDIVFQLFKAYKSCPVPEFQEAIGELRRKYNRGDQSITKEFLMAEALSTYNALVLEKSWITHDPKAVSFANFISKTEKNLESISCFSI